MRFETWKRELEKGIIRRTEETPRILRWIYDAIDEDVEEEEEPPCRRGHPSPVQG